LYHRKIATYVRVLFTVNENYVVVLKSFVFITFRFTKLVILAAGTALGYAGEWESFLQYVLQKFDSADDSQQVCYREIKNQEFCMLLT
jgi:hypothetical protein